MKVGVDTEAIEALQFSIQRLSGEVDECHAALRCLYSELGEDQMMLMRPQTHSAIERLGMAAGRIYRVNSRLGEIARMMQSVNSGYCECDKRIFGKIDKLAANLKMLSDRAAAILCPAFIAGTENDEQEQCARSLAEIVAKENVSLEMSNLAAIAAVISEDYGEDDS